MKKIIFLFCSTLIAVSCNTKQTDSKETTHDFGKDKTTLYVVAVNIPEPDSKQIKKLDELSPVKKDEIRSVTTDHFEISLNELSDGSGYMAQRNTDAKMEYICDWCGATTTFKTTEGFLNFMSERGYKLASQTENTHSKDYIFNKI